MYLRYQIQNTKARIQDLLKVVQMEVNWILSFYQVTTIQNKIFGAKKRNHPKLDWARRLYTAWKVSIFGVYRYLSVFSPNVGKYGPERLWIRTLFMQYWLLLPKYYSWKAAYTQFWDFLNIPKCFGLYTKIYYTKYQDPLYLWWIKHCVKSVQIRSYFWSVFSCIRIEYGKIHTRNNFVFGHFSRGAGS